MMPMPLHRRGFTLLEATIVSGLMALLAVVLSSAWIGVGRPAADLIARSQLFQEMNMAVTALSRDLGGSVANPEGRLGSKTQARWVGWMQPANAQLWLCFDGGTDPNGQADWGPPDTVIVYQLESNALVRWDQNTGTSFTVAKNMDKMEITALGSESISVQLTFKYRQLVRTCTLIARTP